MGRLFENKGPQVDNHHTTGYKKSMRQLMDKYVSVGLRRYMVMQKQGVAACDESAVRYQIGKLIGMTDGQFDDYLAERTELRKSIVAELEAAEENK